MIPAMEKKEETLFPKAATCTLAIKESGKPWGHVGAVIPSFVRLCLSGTAVSHGCSCNHTDCLKNGGTQLLL